MTVIAWDGKTLAADKASTFGAQVLVTTKVFGGKRPDGVRVIGACAGSTVHCHEVQQWILGGAKPDDIPSWQRNTDTSVDVVLVEEGNPHPLLYQNSPTPVRIEMDCFAFGRGGDFAQGVLMAGKDAKTAVLMACDWVNGCGRGVDTLTFD